MTEEDVNKVIAEFMGFSILKTYNHSFEGFYSQDSEREMVTVYFYTESLDSLVPVWKKILSCRNGFRESYRLTIFKDSAVADNSQDGIMGNIQEDKTIQLSAARATAFSIKELNNV